MNTEHYRTEKERQEMFLSMCVGSGVSFKGPQGELVSMERVVQRLSNMNFFTAPASTRFHGHYPGGLFDHSYKVAEVLLELTNKLNLRWERRCSPAIVGLFHDLFKVDLYQMDTSELSECRFKYRDIPSLWGPGHGSKSVAIASTFIQMTPEEVACILYHMGAYEKDEWGNLDFAIRRFHNVLWTHTADMMASKFYNT